MNKTKESKSPSPSLFKIIVLHAGPKDSHTSIETYLVADTEEEVAAWIDREKNSGLWFDDGDDEEPNVRYVDDNCEEEVPFNKWVMLKRGDLEDDEGYDDAYYGVTKWGWEPIPSTPEEIRVMLKLEIAVLANPQNENE